MKRTPRVLSTDEVIAALDASDGETRLLIDILYCTGARISEVLALRWQNVDLEEGTAIVRGKGDKERLVLLGASVRAIRASHDGQQPGDFVFAFSADAARKRLKTATKQLGFRLTPHVLRHSMATHMLDRGAPLAVVAELLGHEKWDTTSGYYWHLASPRLRALLESVNCLPYFAHQRLSHPGAFVNLAEGQVDP